MDNSKSINLIKKLIKETDQMLDSMSADDIYKLYIAQRIKKLKIQIDPECDVYEDEDIDKLKIKLKTLKKELKAEAEGLHRKEIIKKICPKIKKLSTQLETEIKKTLTGYLYDRIKVLNTNVSFMEKHVGICNGMASNIPFLIVMFFELLEEEIKEERVDIFNKSTISNIINKFTKNNNYKLTFESFFNDILLINYISKKKCDSEVNPNTISLQNLYDIANLSNIEEFTIEKFVDIVNQIKSEQHSDGDCSSNDQTPIVNSFGEPFYEDKYVRIFRAYRKDLAIMYGQGYSFCVSSTNGYNYFNKYRFARMGSCGYETTLHFCFFKNKEFQNKEGMYDSGVNEGIFDKWNVCIIDLCWDSEKRKNNIWYYTSCKNDGTHKTDKEGIVKYVKELEKYPINALKTSASRYNNEISDALENGGFKTENYTQEELLMKDYSSDMSNSSDEIKLSLKFKKKNTTLKDILDGENGYIFAEILMGNMNEYNLSVEVIKYIFEKFDHGKLNGDTIVGRTKHDLHQEGDLNVVIQNVNHLTKIEEALGINQEPLTDEKIKEIVEKNSKKN